MVFSYWQNPPELNSAMLTLGPHEFSWRQASMAWGAINAAIATTIMDINSLVVSISGLFQGTTATAAKLAVQPGLLWLESMQAIAEKYMTENEATADSFSACAAEIPQVPVITLNRTTSLALQGTNFLGINTPEIISLESAYTEMWVQAASTMTAWDTGIIELTLPIPVPPSPILANMAGDISSFSAVEGRLGANLGQAVIGRVLSAQAEIDEAKQQVEQLIAKPYQIIEDSVQKTEGKHSDNSIESNLQSTLTQSLGSLLSSALSPLGSLGSISSVVGQGMQPFSQLTQPAIQNLGSIMSQSIGNGIHMNNLESQGNFRSHLPAEIHHRIHGTGNIAGSGMSFRSTALSSAHAKKGDTQPLNIASLPSPGNLRSQFGSIGNMGSPNLGNRSPKSASEQKIERKFLDDVDAYGDLIPTELDSSSRGNLAQANP